MMHDSGRWMGDGMGGWMGGGMWFWPVGCLLVLAVIVVVVIWLKKR